VLTVTSEQITANGENDTLGSLRTITSSFARIDLPLYPCRLAGEDNEVTLDAHGCHLSGGTWRGPMMGVDRPRIHEKDV